MNEPRNIDKAKALVENVNFKTIKTFAAGAVVFFIIIVTNGILGAVETDAYITITAGLGTFGFLLSLQIISSDGATRGTDEAKEVDVEINSLENKVRDEAKKVDRGFALEFIYNYNIKRIKELRKQEFDRLTFNYNERINVLERRVELYRVLSKRRLSWARFRSWQLIRKKTKHKLKRDKLNINNVSIKYDPFTFDDIVTIKEHTKSIQNERQVFTETPYSKTMKDMTKLNITKTVLFYGLQGAVFINFLSRGWGGVMVVLGMVASVVAAWFSSYHTSYKEATGEYKKKLDERVKFLENIKKADTRDFLRENGVVTFYPKEAK